MGHSQCTCNGSVQTQTVERIYVAARPIYQTGKSPRQTECAMECDEDQVPSERHVAGFAASVPVFDAGVGLWSQQPKASEGVASREPSVEAEGDEDSFGDQAVGEHLVSDKSLVCGEHSQLDVHTPGKGFVSYANGNTYDGELYGETRHGYGIYIRPDLSTYEGEWNDGLKSGKGTEKWCDGASYVGEFLADSKHGVGVYESGAGVVYSGQFRNDKMHGDGSYTFPDQRIFVGQFQRGRIHGAGTLRCSNGSTYEGEFEQDLKHGEGIFTWPDGKQYIGQWRNGKPDGKGAMVGIDEEIRDCEWRQGKPVRNKCQVAHRALSDSLRVEVGDAGTKFEEPQLVKGSHVRAYGQSGAVCSGPDAEGKWQVRLDSFDSCVHQSDNLIVKRDELTKVPFAMGDHVQFGGDCGVIVAGPDAGGKFKVQSKSGAIMRRLFKEEQLAWAGCQSRYCLPLARKTHGTATRVLYHKTARGEDIRKVGKMLRGRGGAVGGGIYFAGSVNDCQRKAKSRGWIITALVLLGNAKIVKTTPPLPDLSFWKLNNEGYDSVELRGFNSGTEYIVYSKDQVMILDIRKESLEP